MNKTVAHDRFPAEVYQEVSVALTAALGHGFFAAHSQVYDGLPYSRLIIRPVEDTIYRKRMDFCSPNRDEKTIILMGNVLLQIDLDPPRVLQLQNLLDVALTEQQKALDEKMGRAAIAVMDYVKQREEDKRAERERFRSMWRQSGYVIEKQDALEIHVGLFEQEIHVTLTYTYANFRVVVGGHTHYILTPEYQVVTEILGR